MFLNMIFKELMDIRNYLIHAYFGDFLAFTLVAKPVFYWAHLHTGICGNQDKYNVYIFIDL
jgi:hypothetical protein